MSLIVGFGDLLLRLNPPGYRRFIQTETFEANYTGAELNVCVSLSMMGEKTQFVTRLPESAIAEAALACVRKYKVGTDKIRFGGERIGLMYAEKGASQRPSTVIYDRNHTGFATSEPGMYDWPDILKEANVFYFTGITPALGKYLPKICQDACEEAVRKNIKVVCDLNYRKKLWSVVQAKQVMDFLLPNVDLLIANEEDSGNVLGIHALGADVNKGELPKESYVEVARQIQKRYNVKAVAISLRKSISASDNDWSGMLYVNGQAFFSKTYSIRIVDRIGGGDSFGAGLIYGLCRGYEPQEMIDYAVAASCLKQSIEADFNLSTHEEIIHLVHSEGSGRIQR